MLQEGGLKRSIVLYTMVLGVFLTVLGGAIAITMQQMLRRGANQPQIDIADRYAGKINAGEAPETVIPQGYVDLERDLQPFVIYYDDNGRPGPGTGYLDQAIPIPPTGVFDFARHHGNESVTWQPRRGIRMASVIRRVSGESSGFILAGRSLRLVEVQEAVLRQLVIGGWFVMILILLGGAVLLSGDQSRQPSN